MQVLEMGILSPSSFASPGTTGILTLFIELVNAGVLGKLINSFGVFVPLRRTGMKLTQLKRKTFIIATGMRKHKAWRPSLQVPRQPLGTRRPWAGGWWLVAGKSSCSETANELNVPFGTYGACGIENGFHRAA